jgi:hypothetical protein
MPNSQISCYPDLIEAISAGLQPSFFHTTRMQPIPMLTCLVLLPTLMYQFISSELKKGEVDNKLEGLLFIIKSMQIVEKR